MTVLELRPRGRACPAGGAGGAGRLGRALGPAARGHEARRGARPYDPGRRRRRPQGRCQPAEAIRPQPENLSPPPNDRTGRSPECKRQCISTRDTGPGAPARQEYEGIGRVRSWVREDPSIEEWLARLDTLHSATVPRVEMRPTPTPIAYFRSHDYVVHASSCEGPRLRIPQSGSEPVCKCLRRVSFRIHPSIIAARTSGFVSPKALTNSVKLLPA